MTMEEIGDELKSELESLTAEEPRTCSIEMRGLGPTVEGTVIIDQSLDVTIRGDVDQARRAWLFLLPESEENGERTLGVNRELIASMEETRDIDRPGDFEARWDHGAGVQIRFRASHDPKDIGRLINAIRLNGGVAYLDRGIKRRRY